MKIRNGFVSNSSSSSFIIRGIKLHKNEIIETLHIPQEDIDKCNDDEYEIFDFLSSKFKGLSVEFDGNYFGNRDYETLVIGKNRGNFEDGEVTEYEDPTIEEDKELIQKFEELGFKNKKLKTYIQMISNDNY